MNRTSKDSDRIIITISKTDRQILDRLAEADDRSLSSFCRRILHQYVVNHSADCDSDGKSE